jgi:hypothetical protein
MHRISDLQDIQQDNPAFFGTGVGYSARMDGDTYSTFLIITFKNLFNLKFRKVMSMRFGFCVTCA